MKHFGNYLWLAISSVFIFGCGCSTANSGKNISAFASPSELTATLTNGNNVVLHWKNNSTADGGVWVEFTTPGYDWIQLDAFPSDEDTTQFLHADLAPQTKFIYRLQPFFGKPTKPIEITTGIVSSNATANLSDGPIASTNEISSGENFSIRSLKTFSKAMPTDLTATLSSSTSVDLHWKNHASDEDGYLLEISAHADGGFIPCALLPPNATSFRKTSLPPKMKIYFRVRAFFYGKPSDSVTISTS